ncbi:hypothetical protein H5T58_00285 [Candidatus Parcubacteria bacterium]|nr:hypothetical protein [Candidatus Parcubacteria bacterium]
MSPKKLVFLFALFLFSLPIGSIKGQSIVEDNWCYTFTQDLYYGKSGSEVSALQTALEKEGFSILVSEKQSSFFGESTASAVVGFQQKYSSEILAPLGLKYGTGFVGKLTRAKLNQIFGCENRFQCKTDEDCQWCGRSCVPKPSSFSFYCPLVLPPTDSECRCIEGKCTSIPIPPPTSPEDPVSATLTVTPTQVLVGETITLTISARDRNGVERIFAYYQGRWHVEQCGGAPECTKTFTFSEATPGVKYYYGYVYGKKTNGNLESSWTQPRYVKVTVLSMPTPTIKVLSPNGGEKWEIGKTYTIRWDSKGVNKVLIELTKENTSWHLAYNVNASLGEYAWTIPSKIAPGGNYKIKIIAQDETLRVEDESDSYFSIVSPQQEDPVTGTLSVDKEKAKVGENITLTISAQDDQGVEAVAAYYNESWYHESCLAKSCVQGIPENFKCVDVTTTCTRTFTFSESTPGTKYYYGLVIGKKVDGSSERNFTRPPYVTVRVISEPTSTSFTLSVLKDPKEGGRIYSAPQGIDCGTKCDSSFAQNTQVTLYAQPSPGYKVSSWSGCDKSEREVCVVVMNSSKEVQVKFVQANYTLSVTKNISTGGTIKSNDGKINCGQSCSASYPLQSQVTLSAIPSFGYEFKGWSGCDYVLENNCFVVMYSDREVRANFEAIPKYNLWLYKNIAQGGTVVSSPYGIICDTLCGLTSYDFKVGTKVTLTATPASGYTIGSWSGCDYVSNNACYVTMNSERKVYISFAPISTPTPTPTRTPTPIPTSTTPSLLPDLVVRDIFWQYPYIYVKYCNLGKGTSASDFLIKLRNNQTGQEYRGNPYYRFPVPKPGECKLTGGYTPGLVGLQYGQSASVTAIIDWEGRVAESNENNNSFTKTLPAVTADLRKFLGALEETLNALRKILGE